jgi:hypothetical protein
MRPGAIPPNRRATYLLRVSLYGVPAPHRERLFNGSHRQDRSVGADQRNGIPVSGRSLGWPDQKRPALLRVQYASMGDDSSVPTIRVLQPGTLDESRRFGPVAHLWIRSSLPWVVIPNHMPTYQENAPFGELSALWQQSREPPSLSVT